MTIKNIGAEPVSEVFIFSAPGFENHMRCISVLATEKPTPTTADELRRCDRAGSVVYAGREENP